MNTPVFITFGKYSGQTVEFVRHNYPQYLIWLFKQEFLYQKYPDLAYYIATQYDSIQLELYGSEGCDEAYGGPEFWKDN
jgi:hypothetical protein